ncbi:MAG: hypothetical protein M3430_13690 [Acidobacteriota bacterium]|nr:hypothetical protein [Acidobacteriota bacterium]
MSCNRGRAAFKAVNNHKRNSSEKRLERAIAVVDEKVTAYVATLDECDGADNQTLSTKTPTAEELRQKTAQLKERKTKYEAPSTELEASGAKQISLTDPDARSMVTHFGVTDVCYNVQTAVDSKHKLIVEHEVTNNPTDHAQLSKMAMKAKETLQVEEMNVLADMGY